MKFTIFTSFYNYLDTFDDLVESVLGQTYQNWEWIISDDFSENPDILPKLKELESKSNKIKLILPSFKKEFYWNPPTKQSTGDIFMVLDSDDLPHSKLLEVYKQNFDNFPKVQMISTNSILKWNNIRGSVHSFRMINYGNRCNFIDKLNTAVDGEYNIGDCRAWRNNISLFDPQRRWKECAEDISKTLINEERGMLLYLPRTLHSYAHRENSISKEKLYTETSKEEKTNIINDSLSRKSRSDLHSIEDYYDRVYEYTLPFYLSKLNYDRYSSIIEYRCKKLNPREKSSLKSLYFDHDLRFNETLDCDYLIVKIEDHNDFIWFKSRLPHPPKKQIHVHCPENMLDIIKNTLIEFGHSCYWFIYSGVHISSDLQ
jgi:glycosyltransferase involved in cell wall biosynthesis